jgi:SM-20-related protein
MNANERALAQLEGRGWTEVSDWVDAGSVRMLAADARAASARGEFKAAQVGAGAARSLVPALRADRTRWLEDADAAPATRALLAAFERFRTAVNRRLMLGLFEFEAHFALYPPGAGYGRHVDRFRDDNGRVLSVVLYLNEDWRSEDGGALRIETAPGEHTDIAPAGGKLVAFLSERFAHEVLPARRERLSVAGWFTRRPV